MEEDRESAGESYVGILHEEQPGDEDAPRHRNKIAAAAAAAVGWLIDLVNASDSGNPKLRIPEDAKPVVQEATELAVGAYEGQAKARSLEGQLREAEIRRTYAEERKLNAEEARIRQRTQHEDERMAWERLQHSLELAMLLGGRAEVSQLPDGRTAVVLGSELARLLPSGAEEPAGDSETEAAPSEKGD